MQFSMNYPGRGNAIGSGNSEGAWSMTVRTGRGEHSSTCGGDRARLGEAGQRVEVRGQKGPCYFTTNVAGDSRNRKHLAFSLCNYDWTSSGVTGSRKRHNKTATA